MLVGNLMIGFGNSVPLLVAGRCFNGFSFGGMFVLIPIYCAEISLPAFRPISSALFVICNCVGVALSYKIGTLVNWRQVAIIHSLLVGGIPGISWVINESTI